MAKKNDSAETSAARTETIGSRGRRDAPAVTTFGAETEFRGVLKFREPLRIRGSFKGTIDATSALFVDKGAVVEADKISVTSLTVAGTVIGEVRAVDRIEMLSGAIVRGDVETARLRIADGVLFEGQCSMTGVDEDVEIFSRPTEEIKSELLRSSVAR
jgi:cytoskeletal protein CcmA (bactofilin family)